MDHSERIQRLKENAYLDPEENYRIDEICANRIASLLNNEKIDEFCMVDAYYYDCSVVPHEVQEKMDLWRDCYLIFGITNEGQVVSKWVDRWDLDSDDPIVDGKVIHKPYERRFVPDICQNYDRMLLRKPIPDVINKLFGVKDEK